MHGWDIGSSAPGRKPAWESKLLQARASDSPAELDSWQSFLACKRARRRIARRLDLGEALNQGDTEELDWSPGSHSQNTSSSSEQRPNSLPNRRVSEQFLPGLDSLSDDGRFGYHSPVAGANLQLMSADRLQAANAAVRQELMDRAWEAAKQREADSIQELARSAPGGLYHMESPVGGGEQPAHQPRATYSAPSSMSNNDSGRHSSSLPLAARRGRGEGYGDSRDQPGKDSSSARDSGRASTGLLGRIQESNSEVSDGKSAVSASSKLQRRSFDLASALGLMSAATSKGEGQDETEIKGYLDTAESAQSSPSQHFSGSSRDNVMRSADEPSLFSLNRVLTGSETGSASTAPHHRLDSITSLDSLRRAAANMLANMLETPQEEGGSEPAEEDVSGLDTPEFCTPSPSPFKGAAPTFPVAVGMGEMQPGATDAGAGSGAPLTQPVGGTEDQKELPPRDRPEIADSAASVVDRAPLPDSQTATATETETAVISPREVHDTSGSEALMTLSYLVASEAQQSPAGKEPAPEASSASASAGRNSTSGSFAFDTDLRPAARSRAFVPPVPVLPPVKMQTSSASASPSTMATPTRPLFPGPWTDPSSSKISPQRSPASARERKTKQSYAAATNAADPALGAAVFAAGSAMPRSPGQQQGSAHSEATQREATQRRSLLRLLSSKAMQLCSPKARRTDHKSGASPRASLEQARGEAQRQSVEAARFLTPRASYTVTIDGWPASPGSSPARVRASPDLVAPNASPPRPLSALPLWGILGLGSGPAKSRPSSVDSSWLSSRPLSRTASGEHSRRSSMDLPALSHSAVFRKAPVAGLEDAAINPASNPDQAPSLSPQASGGSKRFLRAGSAGSPIPTIIEEEKGAPHAPGKAEAFGTRLHPRHDLSPEKPAPGSSGDLADYLSTYTEVGSGPSRRPSWLSGGYGSAAVDPVSWRSSPPADNMSEGRTSTIKASPFAAERFGRPVSSSGASAEIQPDEPMEDLAGDAIRPETPSHTELGAPVTAGQDGSMTVRTRKEVPPPAQKTQAKRKVRVDAGEAAGRGSLGVLVMEDSSNQYEGQVGTSGMHGLGVLRFEGGSSYAGQWEHSVYQGAGIETFSNGSYYVGQFHNGTHHGSGVCHYADNTTYSGQWHAGLQHGLGCQDAADGAAFFYVGGFHRGLRHGLGVAIFANGEEFSGELAADAPHGYGVARLGSKKGIYEGQWAHGMRHGWAVSTLPNNSMWAGQWVFGKACWLAELYLLGDGELPDQYLEAMDLCDEAARLARAAGLAATAQAKSIRLPGSRIQVAIHNASKEACAAAREAHVYRQKAQILCSSSHGAESGTMSQH